VHTHMQHVYKPLMNLLAAAALAAFVPAACLPACLPVFVTPVTSVR
jgi:hypothetical protein